MKSPEGLKITVSQTFVGWNPEQNNHSNLSSSNFPFVQPMKDPTFPPRGAPRTWHS